jgi:hypothetical protein
MWLPEEATVLPYQIVLCKKAVLFRLEKQKKGNK